MKEKTEDEKDYKCWIIKDAVIVPQVEEQFEMALNKVFMIPWGHIKLLIDKCHDDISNMAHIFGGIIGGVIGFSLNKK